MEPELVGIAVWTIPGSAGHLTVLLLQKSISASFERADVEAKEQGAIITPLFLSCLWEARNPKEALRVLREQAEKLGVLNFCCIGHYCSAELIWRTVYQAEGNAQKFEWFCSAENLKAAVEYNKTLPRMPDAGQDASTL